MHGDDFTTSDPKGQLDWFEKALADTYELTLGGRLGPAGNDQKEATVLNRVVRWTPAGLEYEADPRQVERLLEEIDLAGDGVNGSATPGVKTLAHQTCEEKELPPELVSPYRAWAARANYLAADRPDAQFAAKEVCRYMATPTTTAMCALKRLCRYLKTRPRLVLKYGYQEATHVDVYSDTDHAGCIRTRKSTSGGCMMVGHHVIKTWSATQATISLSSGEAEYYGVLRAAGIALGHRSLLVDLGLRLPCRVWTDSSAAIGICARQGLGKMRHIECHTLWIQQRLRQGDFELRKIRGEVNPPDLFTKYIESRPKLDQLISLFQCEFLEGRAAAAPALRKEGLRAFDANDLMEDALKFAGDEEPEAHDPEVLPHDYLEDEMQRYFPQISAPAACPFGEQDLEGPEPALTDPLPDAPAVRVHRRTLLANHGPDERLARDAEVPKSKTRRAFFSLMTVRIRHTRTHARPPTTYAE